MRAGDRATSFRRTRRTAIAVGVACALTFVATDPGAAAPGAPAQETPFNPGTGNAVAIAYKVNPVFGKLSFGITVGEAIAGHQNTGATGQAQSINLGVIGVALGGEGCNGGDPTLPMESQPQPTIVASGDPNAEKGKTEKEAEFITKFARATAKPFAEAVSRVAPLGSAAAVEVSGGTARATSGVVADGVREARAITELASVSILDGLIKLGDMRWEAYQRSGAETESRGTFTIGKLEIAGQSIPLPNDPLAQAKALTDALREFGGIDISMPTVTEAGGVIFVEPLKIGVVPAEMRDDLVSQLLGLPELLGLPPELHWDNLRTQLTNAILNLGCGKDLDLLGNNGGTIITVLDLVLGTATGAGSTHIELGGVQATTAEIQGFEGLGDFTPPPPLPPLEDAPADLGAPSSPSFTPPADVAAPPVVDTPAPVDSSPRVETAQPVAAFRGERGGPLMGVGLGGLIALAVAAEMDRRKMRRAQRLAQVTSS